MANGKIDYDKYKRKEYPIDKYLPETYWGTMWGQGNLQQLDLDWILREMSKYRYIYYRLADIISDFIGEELEDKLYELVLDKLGYINAKYPPEGMTGLVGDGVANDGPALKQLLEDVDAAGFCKLYLPKGTYNIDPIQLPRGMVLMGECAYDVILNLNSNATDHLIGGNLDNNTICNLTLRVNMQNQSNNLGGIYANVVDNCNLYNLIIYSAYEGITLKSLGVIKKTVSINNVDIIDAYVSGMGLYGSDIHFVADCVTLRNMEGNLEKEHALLVNSDYAHIQSFTNYAKDVATLLECYGDNCDIYMFATWGTPTVVNNTGTYNKITVAGATKMEQVAGAELKYDHLDVTAGEKSEYVTEAEEHYQNQTTTVAEQLYLDTEGIKYSTPTFAGKYFKKVGWKDREGNDYGVLVDAKSSDLIEQEFEEVKTGASDLGAKLDKEIADREAADAKEVADREAAIAAEAQAREEADTALGERIDAEAQARETADLELEAKVTAEIKAREDGDSALDAKLTEEITNREQGDATNKAAIDANTEEIAKLKAGSGEVGDEIYKLMGDLAKEIQDRQTADTELQENINDVLNKETEDVANLQENINRVENTVTEVATAAAYTAVANTRTYRLYNRTDHPFRIYIAKSGNDKNDGRTKETAIQSMDRLSEIMTSNSPGIPNPGWIVFTEAGTYEWTKCTQIANCVLHFHIDTGMAAHSVKIKQANEEKSTWFHNCSLYFDVDFISSDRNTSNVGFINCSIVLNTALLDFIRTDYRSCSLMVYSGSEIHSFIAYNSNLGIYGGKLSIVNGPGVWMGQSGSFQIGYEGANITGPSAADITGINPRSVFWMNNVNVTLSSDATVTSGGGANREYSYWGIIGWLASDNTFYSRLKTLGPIFMQQYVFLNQSPASEAELNEYVEPLSGNPPTHEEVERIWSPNIYDPE